MGNIKNDMLNVRLSDTLEKKLKQYSVEQDLSKSAIVKEALVQYFSEQEKTKSPFTLGQGLFGLEGSGNAEASVTYKKALREKLNAKYSH